jgi:hypothetical protein
MKHRTFAFAVAFWLVAAGFIALDWSRATPHNRFAEPPPWQLGHDKGDTSAHCAAPLK